MGLTLVDLKKLKKDMVFFNDIKISVVIDHGRAGNMFFMRLFDMHPEVLAIGRVGYFYSGLMSLFKDREKIGGKEAYEWVVSSSEFKTLALDMSHEIEKLCYQIGEDPFAEIDRLKIREVLKYLIKNKNQVSRRDIFIASHLAYCYGTDRNIARLKYILINDSMTNKRDWVIFEAMQRDFAEVKIIHLVRDPRANFASLRHQYVNAFGTMYPLKPVRIWRSLPSNSVWLWVLYDSTVGAVEMHSFKKKLSQKQFYTVRIEDININFLETMKRLTKWLEVDIDIFWADKNYSVTSVGRPWRGISAYKSYYQKNTQGPLSNDSIVKNKFARPDPGLPQKWKKHVLKSEIKFLETIYYDEMKDYGYEFEYIKDQSEIRSGLFSALLPFAGEIPKAQWYFALRSDKKLKDIIIKITYLPVLSVSYVISRVQMYIMYMSGKLITRPKQ